jgi:hypothetical protein
MIDSQAVKNTCNARIESKGFCFYKCTNGIKRHLAVDILGFPFFTHCTKASVPDDQGLIEMLTHNIDYFKLKPVDLPKTTILLDHGYHPEKLTQALEAIYPEIILRFNFNSLPSHQKLRKRRKDNLDLCLLQLDGSSKDRMLGSKDVKADAIALRSPQRALHQAA